MDNLQYNHTIASIKLNEGDLIILEVHKETIDSNRFENHLKEIKLYEERGFRSNMAFTVSGYDTDPRELWAIPEVKKWFRSLYKKVPYLFYFLSEENYGINTVFLILVNIQSSKGEEIQINRDEMNTLMEEVTQHAVSYSKKRMDSIGTQFKLANSIMSTF